MPNILRGEVECRIGGFSVRFVVAVLVGTAVCHAQSWSPINVDLIMPMNTSTPGTALTTAIANAGTVSNTCVVGGAGSTGCSYSTIASGLTVGANQKKCSNLGPVQVTNGGPLYAEQSLNYNNIAHPDVGFNQISYFAFNSGVRPTNLTIAGCFVLGMPGQLDGNDYDMVFMQNSSGNGPIIQIENGCGGSGGTFGVNIEVNSPFAHATCIRLIPASTYYFSLNWNGSGGTANLYVYTATGTLIGKTSVSAPAGPVVQVRLNSNENGTDSGTTYYQNLMMNWTTAPTTLFWTQADPWTGVVAPGRAISWASAGVTGGIPTGLSTCTTLGTAGQSPSYSQTVTVSQINTALSSCNTAGGGAVLLNPGTYGTYSSSIIWSGSNTVLRGSGADQTSIVFSGASGCRGNGANVCLQSGSNNTKSSIGNGPVDVTGMLIKGSNTITLASVPNLVVGNPIVLDQCDTGLTTDSCTGTITDSGGILVTDSSSTGSAVSPGITGPYSTQANGGGPERTGRQQFQIVTVTQCDGNTTVGHSCSSGSNITISPGLYMPNWGSSPQAWWAASPSGYLGIEALTLDATAETGGMQNVLLYNCANCWVKGIRSIDAGGSPNDHAHVQMQMSNHDTIRDSYFYLTQGWTTTSYGVESYGSSDSLVENNIFQAIASPYILNGPGSGDVWDYNFSTLEFYNAARYNQNSHGVHAPVDFSLVEGNVGNNVNSDVIHGTHNFETYFRNYYSGPAPTCWGSSTNTATSVTALATGTFASCNSNLQAISADSFSRFYNIVGNVLGTTGVNTVYESQSNNNPVIRLGLGNGSVPNDNQVQPTAMIWGNCNSSNSFGTCPFTSTEVPSGFITLATTQAFYLNPVPSSHTLPGSFFYASQPSWWPSTKVWPPVGPDVTGGNIANVGGYANTIPAEDCYLNMMGGPANGISNSALTFNANTCYAASGQLLTGPTNLQVIVQ